MSAAEPINAPLAPVARRVSVRHGVSAASPQFTPNSTDEVSISQLERSAEELSQGGSDIGEEIRKMEERSRQNSIASAGNSGIVAGAQGDPLPQLPKLRRIGSSRTSSSNLANSRDNIVDVHNIARAGGYSPAGFVTSPTSSVRSGGSWTQASSMNRVASSAKSSRLQYEPLQEGRPLDFPLAPSSASMYSQEHAMSRQASQSSFSRQYDVIAGQIEDSLQEVPPTVPSHHDDHHDGHHEGHDVPDRPHSTDTFQEAQIAFKDFDGVHFSPETEEYVELDREGHEVRRVSARTSSGSLLDAASLLRTPKARPMSYGAPPSGTDMVYYPAPVPRMLNLPKRLSKLPAAHTQAQRRSQMLYELPPKARQSAPWIPPITFSEDGLSVRSHPELHRVQSEEAVRSQRSGRSGSGSQPEAPRGMLNQRMSMANINALPPQLRASMFFEHQSIQHHVEIKSESAVATLDSILAASATAPVNAFTDHPYAGDVRKSVYAPERTHLRKNTSTSLDLMSSRSEEKDKKEKKRSSSIGKLFRRNSTDLDGETKQQERPRPASRASTLDFNQHGQKLKKRQSQLSLGNDLDRHDDNEESQSEIIPERRRQSGLIDQAINASPVEERIPSESRPMTATSKQLTEAQQIDEDFKEQEAQSDPEFEEEDDAVFVQPSTLLAELQVRKAQLKSRNRTAATAFPGGMHSTLLQLDAVEQMQAKKRQKQRVALAWEDPELRAQELAQQDAEDEDVPLGMLYPNKDGVISKKLGDGRDWSRPLGLMERRELEDNEPLSSRRTRLNPGAAPRRTMIPNMSQLHLAGQPDISAEEEPEDEHADETLAQRNRRLRTKEKLDNIISDFALNDGERPISTFSASVLDQFPEITKEQDKRSSTESKKSAPVVEEEETLGQRRARLQREREASGEATTEGAARPPLRQSASMANILAANPIGQRNNSKNQQAVEGTLLHTANQQQMRHKQDLVNTNIRSASYMLDKPLVDSRPRVTRNVSSGLLAEQRSRPANGAFSGGMYNTAEGNMVPNANAGLLGAQRSRAAKGAFANPAYNQGPMGMQASASMPMFGMPYHDNVQFASPTAAMGYGYSQPNLMGGYQMPAMQQMNAPAYMALSGGHVSMMGMPGAGYNQMLGMGTYAAGLQQQMGMGMGIDPATQDPNQRAAIDRWRIGVAQ